MQPIISKKTVYELQEHFVATTILRVIEQEMDAAEIRRDESFKPDTSGQRRILIQQHLDTLDLGKPQDARKLLKVFASVLGQLEVTKNNPIMSKGDREYASQKFDLLCRLLKHDGHHYLDGQVTP